MKIFTDFFIYIEQDRSIWLIPELVDLKVSLLKYSMLRDIKVVQFLRIKPKLGLLREISALCTYKEQRANEQHETMHFFSQGGKKNSVIAIFFQMGKKIRFFHIFFHDQKKFRM